MLFRSGLSLTGVRTALNVERGLAMIADSAEDKAFISALIETADASDEG